MIEFDINLIRDGEDPLYLQIYEYIRRGIISKAIMTGEKLPSIRKLANHLHVGRNTIETAYEQLLLEGYIESRERRGYFAALIETSDFIKEPKPLPVTLPIKNQKKLGSKKSNEIVFKPGTIDSQNFPYAEMRRLMNRCLRPETEGLFYYGHPQGEYRLRRAIASYIYQARGVVCVPEQIVITAGTLFSMDMLCKLLDPKLDTIAVENPGFIEVRRIIELNGKKWIPIPAGPRGMEIGVLEMSDARAVKVSPAHQTPFGGVLSIDQRLRLLKWAEGVDGWILEDDYEGEFRNTGHPIPAMQGWDRSERTIYMYSFSSSLLQGFRINFFVLPNKLLEIYKEKLSFLDQPVSLLHQHVLCRFIEEGHWERHIRKMRNIYRRKNTVLLESIKTWMNDRVDVLGSEAGMTVVLRVKNGMTEKELITSAKANGVAVFPVSIYYADPKTAEPSLVRLGYADTREDDIREGISRLSKAWKVSRK